MKMLGWIALVALVLLAFFAVANWALLTAPATLNLIALDVQGPLGLILLGATLVLVGLFAVYALSLRTTALVETRRHMKELEAQRKLAETAEASRLTGLSSQLDEAFARTRALIDETRLQTLARNDALEASLMKAINETSNALFANIGQVDDKLDALSPRSSGAGKV
jgi:uncharacterized integral membrane protein